MAPATPNPTEPGPATPPAPATPGTGNNSPASQFASALVGEGFELVRTQLPFDVTSEGVLSGDIGAAGESGEAPRFTIMLARQLP